MNTKLIRFISTTAAIIAGILLINAITLLGSKSNGPIEDLLVKTGSYITSIETYFIHNTNKKQRSRALKWFKKYQQDLSRLKDPEVILLGAFDNHSQENFQSIIQLENALETTFPIMHIYTAWGSKHDQRFPLTRVKAIYELGSIPMITWEPWLIDFDKEKHSHLKEVTERDINGLKDISEGVYDFYLERWVTDMKLFDQPLFIRLGHEMNDPYRYTWGPQNNEPEDFVAAWKHVVDYFNKAGLDQVIWVWSPHIAYGNFDAYYPGDDYVDWVGVGTLNYGTVASWSAWWTFDEILGNHYEQIDRFGKPIMATEFGSLAVGGDRALWYQEAMCNIPAHYPNLKAIVYFHFDADNTLTYKTLDWKITNNELITNAIVTCRESWPDSLVAVRK